MRAREPCDFESDGIKFEPLFSTVANAGSVVCHGYFMLHCAGTMGGYYTPNVRARASHVDCSFQQSSSFVEGVRSQRISVL